MKSTDMTGEMVDIKGRLEAKRQARAKYMEFLQNAKNTDDVLKIQKEINEIQEDIESADTRLNYLGGQTRYSTINLVYFEEGKGYDSPARKGYMTRISNAFANGISIVADFFIVLLAVWPLWVIVAVVIIVIKKHGRKNIFPKNQVGNI